MENLISQDLQETYNEEWLLFEILEIDEKNQPRELKLIWHGKEKEEGCKKALELNIKRGCFFYNGEVVPKGYHVAL